MLSLCNNWEFTENWSDAFARGEGQVYAVRIPHTVKDLPLHYIDHNAYQMVFAIASGCPFLPNMPESGCFYNLTVPAT